MNEKEFRIKMFSEFMNLFARKKTESNDGVSATTGLVSEGERPLPPIGDYAGADEMIRDINVAEEDYNGKLANLEEAIKGSENAWKANDIHYKYVLQLSSLLYSMSGMLNSTNKILGQAIETTKRDAEEKDKVRVKPFLDAILKWDDFNECLGEWKDNQFKNVSEQMRKLIKSFDEKWSESENLPPVLCSLKTHKDKILCCDYITTASDGGGSGPQPQFQDDVRFVFEMLNYINSFVKDNSQKSNTLGNEINIQSLTKEIIDIKKIVKEKLEKVQWKFYVSPQLKNIVTASQIVIPLKDLDIKHENDKNNVEDTTSIDSKPISTFSNNLQILVDGIYISNEISEKPLEDKNKGIKIENATKLHYKCLEPMLIYAAVFVYILGYSYYSNKEYPNLYKLLNEDKITFIKTTEKPKRDREVSISMDKVFDPNDGIGSNVTENVQRESKSKDLQDVVKFLFKNVLKIKEDEKGKKNVK